MFHIITLYISLDIQTSFFGYLFGFFVFSVFRVIRSDPVNNTSGSDMFCTTLQDPFGYFLHFGPGTDRVFRFGFGSDFGLWILFPGLHEIIIQKPDNAWRNKATSRSKFMKILIDSFAK